MSTLAEIEDAAAKLPPTQQKKLLSFLTVQVNGHAFPTAEIPRVGRSVLDIAPVSVGEVLPPLSTGDDLLGEMLDNRA